MMTKKHFEAVANIFHNEIEQSGNDFASHNALYIIGYGAGVEQVATALADLFEKENPRFDREKFLDACGMGE